MQCLESSYSYGSSRIGQPFLLLIHKEMYGCGLNGTYINNTSSTRLQAGLDQLIILSSVGLIQRTAKLVVEQILPAHWETEDVHLVILDEVLHLALAVGTTKAGKRRVRLANITSSLDDISFLRERGNIGR